MRAIARIFMIALCLYAGCSAGFDQLSNEARALMDRKVCPGQTSADRSGAANVAICTVSGIVHPAPLSAQSFGGMHIVRFSKPEEPAPSLCPTCKSTQQREQGVMAISPDEGNRGVIRWRECVNCGTPRAVMQEPPGNARGIDPVAREALRDDYQRWKGGGSK